MTKNILNILLFLFCFSQNSFAKRISNDVSKAIFEENKGQIRDQNNIPRPDILYSGSSEKMSFHIRKNGISYQLQKRGKIHSNALSDKNLNQFVFSNHSKINEKEDIDIYRVDIDYVGCNLNPRIKPGLMMNSFNSYYNVPNRIKPITDVNSFSSLTVQDIYEGIDLYYYSNKFGYLETDIIVKPGFDYRKISYEIKGALVSINENEELVLSTKFGEIKEGKLEVFQLNKKIGGHWKINFSDSNSLTYVVGYEIEDYNKKLELRIDPPTRVWGTYYGGSENEYGFYSTVDKQGNVYLTGVTSSFANNVIATTGSHQVNFGNNDDAFLVKFDSNGVRKWGTYYGGFGDDFGHRLVVDSSSNIYMTGHTSSTNSITTPNSFQSTKTGNASDAFLVKFDSNGVRKWGTYYGGELNENAFDCAIDKNGYVYIVGFTNSIIDSFISTPFGFQQTLGGGNDAFLVKFDGDGQRIWGTYYGGAGEEFGISCSVDSFGNVFMSGNTNSAGSNSLATQGSHQEIAGGGPDCFLVKFDSNGVRQWATYYGGLDTEEYPICRNDYLGNVYIEGSTNSNINNNNQIATTASHQSNYGGGYVDIFVVKFNTDGVRQWASYYGGAGNEFVGYPSFDNSGNVYISGSTNSNSAISTPGSFQDTLCGSSNDCFIVKFDSNGVRQWGTYIGGTLNDNVSSCVKTQNGIFYVSGSTQSLNGISTTNCHQEMFGGGNQNDAFLMKFYETTFPNAINELKPEFPTLILYPNPTTDYITLINPQTFAKASVKILNLSGDVIYEEIWSNKSNKVIDLKGYSNGIYTVIIYEQKYQYIEKFTICK